MITSSHCNTGSIPRRNTWSHGNSARTTESGRGLGLVVRHFVLISGLIAIALIAGQNRAVGDEPIVRATSDVFKGDRVDLSGVSPVTRVRGRAVIRNATPIHDAAVRTASALGVSPLDAAGAVQPTSYYETEIPYGAGVMESSCGCDSVCDCAVGGVFAEPGCGIEAGCGVESWIEPGCGCEGVGCDLCCDGYDPSCGCNACSGGLGNFIDCLFPRLRIQWSRLDLFAGVAGHTGPMNFANISATGTDRRGTGSFGFYEGFNKGTSLRFFGTDMAWQSGVRFLQNNLSGAGFSDETRSQIFVTSGLFRTVDYGFQYGLVLDYLYEDWYYRGNLMQLRGELGWVNGCSNVFGLKFAAGIDDDTATTSVVDNSGTIVRNAISFEATTQYRLFYRQRLARCGSCEGFAGWTENSDGLLGIDVNLPIHGSVLWNTSATYLIPDEVAGNGGNQQEGWNLAFGFTFRPGGLGRGSRYSRPLLNVADNGTMMVDRR